jgi:hypothetical protein
VTKHSTLNEEAEVFNGRKISTCHISSLITEKANIMIAAGAAKFQVLISDPIIAI